jgi:hypothetical protein
VKKTVNSEMAKIGVMKASAKIEASRISSKGEEMAAQNLAAAAKTSIMAWRKIMASAYGGVSAMAKRHGENGVGG